MYLITLLVLPVYYLANIEGALSPNWPLCLQPVVPLDQWLVVGKCDLQPRRPKTTQLQELPQELLKHQARRMHAQSYGRESQARMSWDKRQLFMQVGGFTPWMIMAHQNVFPALQNLFNEKQCFSAKWIPSLLNVYWANIVHLATCMIILLPHHRRKDGKMLF